MAVITVTIITLNEADRIAETLAAVDWADEVLVVDSGSDDDTVAIAEQAGATVVQQEWLGYGKQKNRAADLARNDLILNIDADERVDKVLAAAIQNLPAELPHPAYSVWRENHMCGKPLHHWPWARERQIRVYDRRRACYNESSVHESVQATSVGRLPGRLRHDSYRDWHDMSTRQIRYAELWAGQAEARGRRARLPDLLLRPGAAFLRDYLLHGWVCSGVVGWQMARQSAYSVFIKYRLLRERHCK